jgi:DNA primase
MPEGVGSRQAPASGADHLLRILLAQASLWQGLSAEEHEMLCALPTPHGPLFTWLDAQWHEHGDQPWGLLREGLRGHPQEDLATRLVARAMEHDSTAADADSAATQAAAADAAGAELRQLLNKMLVERLKAQESAAITAASSDPSALQRYRDLQKRRTELERQTRALAAAKAA